MRAVILGQIPDSDTSTTVAADDFTLVWVDDNVIDWAAVAVAALDGAAAGFPNLDSSILRAGNHPFALTVERNPSDVVGMTLEGQNWVRIRRFDIIELDAMMTSSCEESLVWRDAEAVDLRVRMLDGTRADSRKSLPEPGDGKVRWTVRLSKNTILEESTNLMVWS